ncbi:hypothetical protein GW17_00056481 [Ensete ventricosum]|nr:hypothetical protein GW17_00056481 [Ensete ventricosum]
MGATGLRDQDCRLTSWLHQKTKRKNGNHGGVSLLPQTNTAAGFLHLQIHPIFQFVHLACIHRPHLVPRVSMHLTQQFLLLQWCIHMTKELVMVHLLNHSSLARLGLCINQVAMEHLRQMVGL